MISVGNVAVANGMYKLIMTNAEQGWLWLIVGLLYLYGWTWIFHLAKEYNKNEENVGSEKASTTSMKKKC